MSAYTARREVSRSAQRSSLHRTHVKLVTANGNGEQACDSATSRLEGGASARRAIYDLYTHGISAAQQ